MNAQNNANFSFSSPFPTMVSFGHPPTAQPEDPNSPALFKENVKTVQSQISFVRTLAHQALHSIKGAYQPGSSPAQIAQNLATLRQNLQVLNETLLNSGVGSLPLLPLKRQGLPQRSSSRSKPTGPSLLYLPCIRACRRLRLSPRISWRLPNRHFGG
ncbi:hypothetical protein BC834DRAFT_916998, partial [Gloeopeniophorella convolvens]